MPWQPIAVAVPVEIMPHVPSMSTDLSTVPAQNVTVTVNSLGGATTRYAMTAASAPAEPTASPAFVTEPADVADSPAMGRVPAAAGAETPQPAAHRGSGAHGSDRLNDARSQTAKPSAAARSGNRPSAYGALSGLVSGHVGKGK